ncbi:lysophospholipid acyltransferase family protein [Desmospora profundinema]|uniref:1-acyl-sn-glycerol-3-phosphate acyltransferase n=1 Tax=Desmospora profundinema TaxID=1571184 RepID=A0ABU1IIC5_9BACL|nr:lysophospholipid acyltransferase family protein [Desmospora profundinema]MDR6224525.1 1-acyl-sn-glycerol-3-phosphate acyltransferase [Desmospora profundinema]
MWYRLFRQLFRMLFFCLYRWEVTGKEKVPAQGPVVVCCNHINNLDPPLVGSALKRQVRFMAKEELFKIPVISWLIRRFGAFPVSRGSTDKRALKTALELLKDGELLGVFPEGTRSKTGELGQAHSGAAFIALKSDAVLVPAAITGYYRPFGKIRIRFGDPIDLTPYRQDRMNSQTVRAVTERMMGEIQSLKEQAGG